MLLLCLILLLLGVGAGYLLTRDGGPLSSGQVKRLAAAQVALESRLAEVAARAEAAEAKAQALEQASAGMASAADTAALAERLAAAERAAAAMTAEAKRLQDELDDLRRRPPEVQGDKLSQEAVAAYERELAAIREMVEQELATLREEAAKAARSAEIATEAGASAEAIAALSEINTALDTGADFGPALDRLASLDPDLPLDPLRPFAEGVDTLAVLQDDFPAAARQALAADTAADAGGGFGSFLKAQLGMRSLRPQAGDSADAVLSRAEARLRAGDLAAALAELDALQGPAVEPMQNWRSRAETRLAARAAYADLAAKVRG